MPRRRRGNQQGAFHGPPMWGPPPFNWGGWQPPVLHPPMQWEPHHPMDMPLHPMDMPHHPMNMPHFMHLPPHFHQQGHPPFEEHVPLHPENHDHVQQVGAAAQPQVLGQQIGAAAQPQVVQQGQQVAAAAQPQVVLGQQIGAAAQPQVVLGQHAQLPAPPPALLLPVAQNHDQEVDKDEGADDAVEQVQPTAQSSSRIRESRRGDNKKKDKKRKKGKKKKHSRRKKARRLSSSSDSSGSSLAEEISSTSSSSDDDDDSSHSDEEDAEEPGPVKPKARQEKKTQFAKAMEKLSTKKRESKDGTKRGPGRPPKYKPRELIDPQ